MEQTVIDGETEGNKEKRSLNKFNDFVSVLNSVLHEIKFESFQSAMGEIERKTSVKKGMVPI